MTTSAMTDGDLDQEVPDESAAPPPFQRPDTPPHFILYQSGEEFVGSLDQLASWVRHLLLPVYGREVTSNAAWCPEWWRHPEAVAQLHGLFLAWGSLTGVGSDPTGPATWHRDFLGPTMTALRDPSGPFAGCKSGLHRDKQPPEIADSDDAPGLEFS